MGFFSKLFGLEPEVPAEVFPVGDDNFKKEVLQSELPVLVDVWSDGCGPCQMLVPVVMDLSRKYRGRLKVVELNVARGPKTASKFGVTGTPTVLYFHKGRVRERVVGYRARHYHEEFLDKELLPRIEPQPPPPAA